MRVAICFWGVHRSTQFTINSIRSRIFFPLKTLGISFDVFLHNPVINGFYENQWANESRIKLNPGLWRLIKPDVFQEETQADIDERLNLSEYTTFECPWGSQNHQTLFNCARALYSLKMVTQMMIEKGVQYDYVMFCRPDVLYKTSVTMSLFEELNDENIVLPDFERYPINDRFAVCTMPVAKIFGTRFDHALEYSKRYPLHSETFLEWVLKENNIKIIEKKFVFFRVRCNGKVVSETLKKIKD